MRNWKLQKVKKKSQKGIMTSPVCQQCAVHRARTAQIKMGQPWAFSLTCQNSSSIITALFDYPGKITEISSQ